MAPLAAVAFMLSFIVTSALLDDPVLFKPTSGRRYQYVDGPAASIKLMDTWVKASDLIAASRFNPDLDNQYHLFTRANPTVSQPLVVGNAAVLALSHYNPGLWTVLLMHGRDDSATAEVNRVLLPAFLEAEDCNVIVLDWSVGSTGTAGMINAVTSGASVARFLSWLMETTGASPDRVHVVGYSLGAQSAGNVGRNLGGRLAYITGLDPAHGEWALFEHKFQPTDAVYTEVIHTGAGYLGYPEPLAQVDFYPNGGVHMPGCNYDIGCDHFRCYFYLAEAVRGGLFTGRRCDSYEDARNGNCTSEDTLLMGGIRPKTGSIGIYYLETNAEPPFSRE